MCQKILFKKMKMSVALLNSTEQSEMYFVSEQGVICTVCRVAHYVSQCMILKRIQR